MFTEVRIIKPSAPLAASPTLVHIHTALFAVGQTKYSLCKVVHLVHAVILSLASYTRLFNIYDFFWSQTLSTWPFLHHVMIKLSAYIIKYMIAILRLDRYQNLAIVMDDATGWSFAS